MSLDQSIEFALLGNNWKKVYKILDEFESDSLNSVNKFIFYQACLATNNNNRADSLLKLISDDDLIGWSNWTDTFLSSHPGDPIALFLSANSSYHDGQFEEAILKLNKSLKVKKNLALAYIARANLYRLTSQDNLALQDLNRAAKLREKIAIVYFMRGSILEDLGEIENAAKDFVKALRLDKKYTRVYMRSAELSFKNGSYAAAIFSYSNALKIDSFLLSAFQRRGLLKYFVGSYKSAIRDLTKATKLDSTDFISFCIRGWCNFKNGEFDLAISDFSKAIVLQPNIPLFYFSRAEANYLGKGFFEPSITDLTKSIELSLLDKNSEDFSSSEFARKDLNFFEIVDAYLMRGEIYIKKGNFSKAILDFDHVLELDPIESTAWKGKGLAFELRGEIDSAIHCLNQFLVVAPRKMEDQIDSVKKKIEILESERQN